jgi:hypothetical protein
MGLPKYCLAVFSTLEMQRMAKVYWTQGNTYQETTVFCIQESNNKKKLL